MATTSNCQTNKSEQTEYKCYYYLVYTHLLPLRTTDNGWNCRLGVGDHWKALHRAISLSGVKILFPEAENTCMP